MKKTAILLLLSVFHASLVQAQVGVGGTPYSWSTPVRDAKVPTVLAEPFDATAVDADDAERAARGEIPFYARQQVVNATQANAGIWETLSNGDRLWRLRILSPGALATELFYEDFFMPQGALLYVYDDEGRELLGGFTSYNNDPSGLFTTAQIDGEACVVEYYEPHAVSGQGHFRISTVGHAYRAGSVKADACEVDVVCSPESEGFGNIRNGVVRVSIPTGTGVGYCTGSLVNNTAADCKPYILTALHCEISTNYAQYKFYFQYQRTGCGTGSAVANKVVTGCTKRGSSNDGGGNTGSDFMLVELNNAIPVSYQPYWIGWDVSGVATTGGKCIHHPAGSEKKISTFTGTTANSGWGVGGTHWRVVWATTTHGHGVTEGGSSGSPLFNLSGRMVGTLTGGGSCCTVNGCGSNTSPTAPDFFGKMSYHWQSNPGPATDRLKAWLDPGNTGATVLDGSWNPCGPAGVNDLSALRPEVRPNPADATITITWPAGTVHGYDIIDPAGRTVLRSDRILHDRLDIDCSALGEGTYVLHLLADAPIQATRFVVIHR